MTTLEHAILGALMRDPDQMAEVLDSCPPEHFGDPLAQKLYQMMVHRWRAGEGIDEISLPTHVATIGSPLMLPAAEVMALPDLVPSASALPAWLADVTAAYHRREVSRLAEWLSEEAASAGDAPGLLDRAATAISRLTMRTEQGQGPVMLGDSIDRAWSRYTSPAKGDQPIPTGLAALDRLLSGGWRRRELVVIGGRPGMGKTALALSSALHSTCGDDHSVLIFSAEMSESQVTDRVVAAWAGVPFQRIRSGTLSDTDLAWINEERLAMRGVRWAVDDRKRPTLETIRAVAKRHQMRHGLDVLVVDYFQILGLHGRTDSELRESRQDLANGLMQLAGELDCAVLLLSQLNRQVSARQDKRPTMADLKATGALEEAAHVVLFPYRPSEDDENADPRQGLIVCAKQRSGPTGEVEVAWSPEQIAYIDAGGNVKEAFGI